MALLTSFATVSPRMPQHAWREAMLGKLPGKWARTMSRRLEELDRQHRNWYHGNVYLREHVERYADAVLPLTANLSDIRECAYRRASDAYAIAERLGDTATIVPSLTALCERWRIAPPAVERPGGFIARVIDPDWWARRLRSMHGRQTEALAIRLGLVSARADQYISDENLRRSIAQAERNAQMLERTNAINEDGEIFTLAELADKSVSNPAIRRGELMLRMRGMEEIAEEQGCACEFAVVTPPSRFHAVRANGSVNEKYDGATPRDTQEYLQRQWSRCRAWLQRRGVSFYGMRTVEAHRDGTPHWNLMVFIRNPADASVWRKALVRYFLLNDSPDEPGAQQHRLRFERITAEQGGAAGYIAKYISKNIDGAGIELGLYGEPIAQTTQRVQAWAKQWGIRQFQAIGGAPVTVWRELRRIEKQAIADSPDALQRAWHAAQRVKGATGDDDKRADYAEFIRAWGGPWIKRKDASMWLHKEAQEGVGRYGDPLGTRAAGVVVRGPWAVDMGGIVGTIHAVIAKAVASVRRTWTIVKAAAAKIAPSRTRVNNCTDAPDSNATDALRDEQDFIYSTDFQSNNHLHSTHPNLFNR
ncbi:bacteriophage replication A family protein [Burkholderia pseudomallei MSHR4032]|uniref:replication endonuclease n=1 Tax=Burkholderia pseudomallei TaxID=28450 RepID=UPI00016B00F8|nr:replication endonuclease [Burkholderia pseudomallei]AGZ31917.1 bacteriophage replication A family protein [Burkholderia pseudomallei NCTC 13179]KGU89948.1 bacteriophage replication A family protein [Burkholderia pseudomallei MSHR4032]KGV17963.1 bacteriophage replication A family protein [Burkholderia pseudomallei MSHR4503]MBM5584892.1 replication endonuclease [Burkholderia pseudomallei]ONC79841.1 6-pyruvoyl tetrahydropterin synthase [Burkholderia pseudomallei]